MPVVGYHRGAAGVLAVTVENCGIIYEQIFGGRVSKRYEEMIRKRCAKGDPSVSQLQRDVVRIRSQCADVH